MRKPFYKASHKTWFVKNAEGKEIKLAKGDKKSSEPEAMVAWAAMQGAAQPAAPVATGLTLAELIERWLAWVGRHRSAATLQSYGKYANRWSKLHGNLLAANIRGYHVTELCDVAFPETEGFSEFGSLAGAESSRCALPLGKGGRAARREPAGRISQVCQVRQA